MVSIDFVLRTCAQSNVVNQSSGVQERINPFYINSYGENSFGLRTFRFTNDLQERIKFVNRGLTVYLLLIVFSEFYYKLPNCPISVKIRQ
jgi:hypothetical protein